MASTLQLRTFSLYLILSILVSVTSHVAGRDVPTKSRDEQDKKQPEWFIGPDGSVTIPGMGQISVPMPGSFHVPSDGSSSSPADGSQVPRGGSLPGGDGTLAPPFDLGFGVPVPAAGSAAPIAYP